MGKYCFVKFWFYLFIYVYVVEDIYDFEINIYFMWVKV